MKRKAMIFSLALLLAAAVHALAGDTFVLADGQEIEGSVLRVTGSRITLKTRTGVQTYDVMEFHEDTRAEHFEEIEAERVRRRLEAEQRAAEAAREAARQAERAAEPTSRSTPLLIGVGVIVALLILGILLKRD